MNEKVKTVGKTILAVLGGVSLFVGIIYACIQIYQFSHNPYDLEFSGERYPVFDAASSEQLSSMNSAWYFTVINKSKNTIKEVIFKFPQDFASFYLDATGEQIEEFKNEKNLGNLRPGDKRSFTVWSFKQPDRYYEDEAIVLFDGGGTIAADFPVATRGFFKWLINHQYIVFYLIFLFFVLPLNIVVYIYEKRKEKKKIEIS